MCDARVGRRSFLILQAAALRTLHCNISRMQCASPAPVQDKNTPELPKICYHLFDSFGLENAEVDDPLTTFVKTVATELRLQHEHAKPNPPLSRVGCLAAPLEGAR